MMLPEEQRLCMTVLYSALIKVLWNDSQGMLMECFMSVCYENNLLKNKLLGMSYAT